MNKEKAVKQTVATAGGAVAGSALAGYVESEFLGDVEVVQNIPEIVPGAVAVTGITLRVTKTGPKELYQVYEGVAVAGAVGVIDRLMNRFNFDLF